MVDQMERLLRLIVARPEVFGDEVFLPCPFRQLADVLQQVVEVGKSRRPEVPWQQAA